MSARNEKAQSWTLTEVAVGEVILGMKVPQDPTLINDKGEVDMAVGRIKDLKGHTLVESVTLPSADLSNLITEGYRHLVMGGDVGKDVVRADAVAILVAAMKLINYNGTVQLIGQTTDAGQFEFAGNTVTWQRMVSNGKVTTSYNTQTLGSENGKLRQGTWTLLEATVADVQRPQAEYTEYATALAGEEHAEV